MPLNLGVMSAAVTLDDSDYRKKLSGLENASGTAFKKIAQLAGMYLSGRAISGFVADTVKAYSNLEEETSKFNVVFSGLTEKRQEYINKLRSENGQSEYSAMNLLSGTGDILTGFGFDKSSALELSMLAAQLGTDLASFSNYAGGAKGATDALTKAMLGETEQAKMLGIVIRQDDKNYQKLTEQAMTTGVTVGSNGEKMVATTQQQAKAIAALAMAYQQSPNAIGDFLRTQDSLANQSRILQNRYEELKQKIGKEFADSASSGIGSLNAILGKVNELDPATLRLIGNIAALTGGMALLSKTGILSKANSAMGALFSGSSGVKQQAELDVAQTTENLKRAEYAKTDAFREAHAKLQELRIARLSVSEATAVKLSAHNNLTTIQKGGDSAEILKAKKQLETASLNLTKAQLAESQATQGLSAKHNIARVATEQHTVAKKANSVATVNLTKTTTVFTTAQTALSAGINKVKLAMSGLYAALGPVGVAMLAISAIYMAYNKISESSTRELDANIELAKAQKQSAEDLATAHATARDMYRDSLSRLEELSRYESLNNTGKQEATDLIAGLTQKYGDLGISLDTITGKLIIGADAWNKLKKSQSEEYGTDVNKNLNGTIAEVTALQNGLRNSSGNIWSNSFINNSGVSIAQGVMDMFSPENKDKHAEVARQNTSTEDQLEIDRLMQLSDLNEQISGFEALRNKFITENDNDSATGAQKIIDKLKEQLELEKQRDKFLKDGKVDENGNKIKSQTDAELELLKKITEKEWKIKFDSSDSATQVKMLGEKIDQTLKEKTNFSSLDEMNNADRSSLNEVELKVIEEIIGLEKQRADLRKTSLKDMESELKNYTDMYTQLEKQRREKEISQQITKLENSGNKSGAMAIMQQEYSNAKQQALTMRSEYERAVIDAGKDKILTEDEKKRITELRSKLSDALSGEERWRDKVGDYTKDEKSSSNVVSAWSSEVLNAMLGSTSKPAEDTAKNTKEMLSVLKRIENDGGMTY